MNLNEKILGIYIQYGFYLFFTFGPSGPFCPGIPISPGKPWWTQKGREFIPQQITLNLLSI